MAEKNKDRISIANIIAAIGLAGIAVISCFGQLFRTADGKPGWPIIFGILLAGVLGFFLYLAIKAKTANDNLDKWKFVEWGSLGAYVLIAVFFAAPFLGFFYILGAKDAIQSQARQEVKAIREYYQQYDFQQAKFYDEAVAQLDNYLRSSQADDGTPTELSDYVANYVTTLDDWREIAKLNLERVPDKQLEEIAQRIEEWNILQLSTLAEQLEDARSDAKTSIDGKLVNIREQNHLIPVISGGGGIKPYTLEGYAEFYFEPLPEPALRRLINDTRGFNALGIVVYVLLNIMVLLNYVIARRTLTVRPVKTKATKGLDL